MTTLNWTAIGAAMDQMQELLCTEAVTLYHYSSSVVADDPYSEPSAEPSYTAIEFSAGVSVHKQTAKIEVAGQEINADYEVIVSTKALNAVGIETDTQAKVDLLANDRILIRQVPCSITKVELSGYNGSRHTWVLIYAVREVV